MANVFSRIDKRAAFPVEVGDETVWIREPTIGEITRIQALATEQATGLALGLCLVDKAGVREIPQMPDESDADFSSRVIAMADNCTVAVIRKLSDAILKLTKPVDQKALEKN